MVAVAAATATTVCHSYVLTIGYPPKCMFTVIAHIVVSQCTGGAAIVAVDTIARRARTSECVICALSSAPLEVDLY